MGILDGLFGKRCSVCRQKLEFGGKGGLTIGSGAQAFEQLLSKRSRMGAYAYRCRNCGALICYNCARTKRCPKCDRNEFELAAQS